MLCRLGAARTAVCLPARTAASELPIKHPERNSPRSVSWHCLLQDAAGPLNQTRGETRDASAYIRGHTCPLEINKINPKRFLGRALTDNDAIVICGDFGFPFLPTDCISEDTLKESGAEHHCIKYARAYRQNIDWLKSFPCDILFIDGNHDNHEFWAKLPTEPWNSGQVHRLPDAPNVIHLMRGEYYTIDGLTVWCMGGAESIDKATRTQAFPGGRRKSRLRKRCGTGWIRWKNTGMMSMSS